MDSLAIHPPYVRVSKSREPVPVKRSDMCKREIQVPMTNPSADQQGMPPQIPHKACEDPKIGWDKDFTTSVSAGHRRLAPF